jgi:hypothetical protein
MEFFQIVLDHWIISLLVVLYVALYFYTVRRYHSELFYLGSGGGRVVRGIVFVGLFLIAPYLRHKLKKQDEQMENERIQEESAEREHKAEAWRNANAERKKLREAWFAENPITLYYNTVNGITVVMTQAMYEANLVTTKRHRRNAMWDKNVLVPNTEAFLFVDANGLEIFKRNAGTNTSDPIGYNYVSGWLTSLDDMVERYKITLEQKVEIFVPLVNQSVLPFAEHQYRRHDVEHYEYQLVVKQAPKVMQPL